MKIKNKCEICKQKESDYAMQYIASDMPSFYSLGWHIRGFKVIKVCNDCRKKIIEKNKQ